MALERFTLQSLGKLDEGRIQAAFEHALKRCEDDCHDRPGVDSSRKVVLTMSLVPVLRPDGKLDSVDVHFELKDTVPKRGSKVYNMEATRGGLLFNQLSDDDVKQGTLDAAFDIKGANASKGCEHPNTEPSGDEVMCADCGEVLPKSEAV